MKKCIDNKECMFVLRPLDKEKEQIIPNCMLTEVLMLNCRDVEILNSNCGNGRHPPYFEVAEKDIRKMLQIGYIRYNCDNRFIAKTLMSWQERGF